MNEKCKLLRLFSSQLSVATLEAHAAVPDKRATLTIVRRNRIKTGVFCVDYGFIYKSGLDQNDST